MRIVLLLLALVCSCRSKTERATMGVRDVLLSEIDEFVFAVRALEEAAPDDSWDPRSIAAMRAAWLRANEAYERVEGPLSPLFPDTALSIDDGYEPQLRGRVDPDPFDENGVRGLRAIERILWSDAIPASVIELERTFPGYTPARFPANAAEAKEFKTKLCHHLVLDAARLRADWEGQRPDLAFALDAVYWSIKEVRIELTKAATHEEESAYARASMAVLSSNLAGARAVYARIRPLVIDRGGGDADRDLTGAFDAIEERLRDTATLPTPPPGWSNERPSPSDLETPFGRLYKTVDGAWSSSEPRSAVSALRRIGQALGIDYAPPT